MKKTIISFFLFLALSIPAMAQIGMEAGVTRYAKDANVGAGDSLHYIGIIDMYRWNGINQAMDSLALTLYGADSLNAGFVVRAFNPRIHTPGTITADTASVSYATPISQAVEALPWIIIAPWHKIEAACLASTGVGRRIQKVEVWIRVKAAGTAMASGGKQMTVKVRPYY